AAVPPRSPPPPTVPDTREYNRRRQLPAFRSGQFRQITPAPDGYQLVDGCLASSWYGEETLDIEAVHAMAPGAKIVYVGGSDCDTGLDEAWAATIDSHVADIV